MVGSQFACIQGYAKAAVQAPGADPGVAYYRDVFGFWTVLSAGEELTASQLGIPADVYSELVAKVP